MQTLTTTTGDNPWRQPCSFPHERKVHRVPALRSEAWGNPKNLKAFIVAWLCCSVIARPPTAGASSQTDLWCR